MKSNVIDKIAAEWAVRASGGRMSAADEVALNEWLAADRRHTGAFARAQAAEQFAARTFSVDTTVHPTPSISRRYLFWGGAASAAATITAGFLLLPPLLKGNTVLYRSGRGEFQSVKLDDGTRLSLNTDTEVGVQYGARSRKVWLLAGEALFSVAPDTRRPFRLRTDQFEIVANAAKFLVRTLPNRVTEILVEDGVVDVLLRGQREATRLSANVRASISGLQSNGPQILKRSRVSSDEIERLSLWREGKISFLDEPLSDAVLEFGRYSNQSIVITDPALGNEVITGVFDVHQPLNFAEAVASSLGARVEVRGKEIWIVGL